MSTTSNDRVQYLKRVPLGSLRLSLWWLRKIWFTRSRPPKPSVVVPLSEDTVTRLLDRNDFVAGWPWSYNYRDEILNQRRIECIDHPSGLDWWQVHIRGYDHPDGIELTAHFEPDPRKHPRAHVTRCGLDIERGMEIMIELFDNEEIGYSQLDPR